MTGTRENRVRIKTQQRKDKSYIQTKPPTSSIESKSYLGAIQYFAKFIPKLSEKTDRRRQLLRKKAKWNCTGREEEDFNEIKKKIIDIPCLAHFTRDRYNMVSTDASRTGLQFYGKNKMTARTYQ